MERNTKLFILSLVLMACGVFRWVSGYFLSYYERRRTSVITIGIRKSKIAARGKRK